MSEAKLVNLGYNTYIHGNAKYRYLNQRKMPFFPSKMAERKVSQILSGWVDTSGRGVGYKEMARFTFANGVTEQRVSY
jgi:hypothetical protein